MAQNRLGAPAVVGGPALASLYDNGGSARRAFITFSEGAAGVYERRRGSLSQGVLMRMDSGWGAGSGRASEGVVEGLCFEVAGVTLWRCAFPFDAVVAEVEGWEVDCGYCCCCCLCRARAASSSSR